jgi:hypothetical protein
MEIVANAARHGKGSWEDGLEVITETRKQVN